MPHAFEGYPDGHARAAAARHEDRFVLPDRVRASGAGAHVGGRAADGPHAAAGAARDQRRHAEQEADPTRTAGSRRSRAAPASGGDIVDEIYLSALSRPAERGRAPARWSRARCRAATGARSSRTSRGPCSPPASSCSRIRGQASFRAGRRSECSVVTNLVSREGRTGKARSTAAERLFRGAVPIASLLIASREGTSARQATPAPDYARDVVPILEANCVRCHSPAQQEGGLLLDTYEDLVTRRRQRPGDHAGQCGVEPARRDDRRPREEEDAAERVSCDLTKSRSFARGSMPARDTRRCRRPRSRTGCPRLAQQGAPAAGRSTATRLPPRRR